MYPIVDIPWLGLELRSQQVVLWTASVLAILVGPYWIARLEGLDASRVRRAQLTLALLPFLTGRLHFILNNPSYFSAQPWNALKRWGGAMHMGGALVGILIGAPLVARLYRIPIARFGDGLVPVIAVCVVAARIGCLLGGCCYGSRCDHFWCLTYPVGSAPFVNQQRMGLLPPDAAGSLAVHPSQIYFLLVAVLTTAVALLVNRRKRYDGQVVWVGMIVLFGGTALLEYFRAPENHRVFWAGIPRLAWTEAALALLGVCGLAVSELRHRRRLARSTAATLRHAPVHPAAPMIPTGEP